MTIMLGLLAEEEKQDDSSGDAPNEHTEPAIVRRRADRAGPPALQLAFSNFPRTKSLDSTGEANDSLGCLPNFASQAGRPGEPPSPASPATPATPATPASHRTYAEPMQTLIIFDWDDTLFPTTELFQNWGLPSRAEESALELTLEQERVLNEWREALMGCLREACSLSCRCLIVTNSQRPWVEDCVGRFVPELRPMLGRRTGGVKVVYAGEHLRDSKRLISQCRNLRPVRYREPDVIPERTDDEMQEELTMAKYAAMKQETTAFYSQYPGQSWKNILSIGDMPYEHDALQEVTFRRHSGPPREHVRTKTIIEPTEPSLSELTHRLRFLRAILPAYVRFDGDFDLHLHEAADPMGAVSEALGMPQLSALHISRHAWGREPAPTDKSHFSEALSEIVIAVHDAFFD